MLFLPPYSPDLNPIEQVFSKLKTLLKKGPTSERSRSSGDASAAYSTASAPPNAQTTFGMRLCVGENLTRSSAGRGRL